MWVHGRTHTQGRWSLPDWMAAFPSDPGAWRWAGSTFDVPRWWQELGPRSSCPGPTYWPEVGLPKFPGQAAGSWVSYHGHRSEEEVREKCVQTIRRAGFGPCPWSIFGEKPVMCCPGRGREGGRDGESSFLPASHMLGTVCLWSHFIPNSSEKWVSLSPLYR